MYQSLKDTGDSFKLFIFAFDDLAYDVLNKMSLPEVEVISLQDFESDLLLSLKKERTRAEYCWTCTSFSILYVLENCDVPEVTYLDADLFFFDKPSILLNEFHATSCDVLITKHRYSLPYSQHELTSGIYCVQFMTFKNNENGLKVLKWWRDRCAECCTAEVKDGKFGDQKYLDDWPERFDNIHVLKHLGGGVAPWNVLQYSVGHGPTVNGEKVVFYHYHGLKICEDNSYKLVSGYMLPQNVIELFYLPYISALEEAIKEVKKIVGEPFNQGTISWNDDMIAYGNIMKTLLDYGVDALKNIPHILVYGAGDIARDVIYVLSILGINKFDVVVSDSQNTGFFMGNKISTISDFCEQSKNTIIIVAVGSDLQHILHENAKKLGFENIISFT